MPKVLIWRNELLRYSETFVVNQARALRRFEHCWGCFRRIDEQALTDAPCWVDVPGSGCLLREIRFPSPEFLTWCRRQGVDLVHSHFGPDACYGQRLARALGVPHVATFHGYDACIPAFGPRPFLRRRIWHFLLNRRELIRQTDLFLCVSDFIRHALLKQGFPQEKIRISYIGTESSERTQDIPWEIDFLFVGRAVEKKGLTDLVRAIQRSGVKANLRVIGDGPELESASNYAQVHGLNIEFVGRQTHGTVLDNIARARALIVPSKMASDGDCEGLPTVLVEACARGVAVLATKHSGISEAVEHMRSGYLVEEGDIEGLAQGIQYLKSNDSICRKLGNRAREIHSSKFNIEMCAEVVENYYQEAMASKGTGL